MDRAMGTPVLLMGWLSVVLLLDRAEADGSIWLQRGLGVATWLVLLLALRWFTPLVRTQALVVVAFATLVEFIFSPTLEVYLYRFENVPAYVPPGHGLVYLSAWALGHTSFVRRHLTAAAYLTVVVGAGWAAWGLTRGDELGAFWFLCLAAFLWKGPSREVYVGAFVVVSHLELLGTSLGNWTWQAQDPILGIGIGNPPSGAPGGYGWFDLVALLVAPWLLGWFGRVRERAGRGRGRAGSPASPVPVSPVPVSPVPVSPVPASPVPVTPGEARPSPDSVDVP